MEIVRYEPDMAGSLAAHYTGVTRGVPHCYEAAAEDLAAALVTDPGSDVGKRLHEQASFVAWWRGSARGLVCVALERSGNPFRADVGVIRFLSYERGDRRVGQALLDAAHEYLGARTDEDILAFPSRYRLPVYHFANAYLSDHLEHVQALFMVNGYRKCDAEVFLDWRDFQQPTPEPFDPAVELRFDWEPGRGTRPGLSIKALEDGEEVGECRHLCGSEFSRNDDAQGWAFCIWLGVKAPLQGKGLGRHLLQRSLHELRQVGYRHASISTDWTNHLALLFYGNCGYRMTDWTYGFLREWRYSPGRTTSASPKKGHGHDPSRP